MRSSAAKRRLAILIGLLLAASLLLPAVGWGQGGGAYVVQPGDTWPTVAARTGYSVAELKAAYPQAALYGGQVLLLPGSRLEGTPITAPPALSLPRQRVTVTYGPWMAGSLGTALDVTLSGVGIGFDVADGPYPAWCIEAGEPAEGSTRARLYSSHDPGMPLDVVRMPWGKINYLLNHKLGSAHDVQAALWQLLGQSGGRLPMTAAARTMASEANQNAAFVPAPGQLIAVIVYSDGMNKTRGNFQEVIIETAVPLPPTTVTPTPGTPTTVPPTPGTPTTVTTTAGTPTTITSTPETPTTVTPTTEPPTTITSTPEAPTTVTPATESPTTVSSTPATPTPVTPTPATTVTLTPESLTTVTPTSERLVTITPTPETPTTVTSTPETPVMVTPPAETPTTVTPTAGTPTTVTPPAETLTTVTPTAGIPTTITLTPDAPPTITPPAETLTTVTPTVGTPQTVTPPAETLTTVTPTAVTPTVTPTAEMLTTVTPTAGTPTTITPTPDAPPTVTPPVGTPTTETPPTVMPPAGTPTTITPPVETLTTVTPPAEMLTTVTPTPETPTTVTPTAETLVTVTPTPETPTIETPTAETPTTVAPTAPTPDVFLTGCVDGYQISDLNAGMTGWTIRARLADGSGPIFADVSDSTGYYRLDRLLPGVYLVWEEMQSGWEPVTPAEQLVTVRGPGACQPTGFTNRQRPPADVPSVAPPCLPSVDRCCPPAPQGSACPPAVVTPCCAPGVVPPAVTATAAAVITPAPSVTLTPAPAGPSDIVSFDWLGWLWRNWLRIAPAMGALGLMLAGLLYWYLKRNARRPSPGGGPADDVGQTLRLQRENIGSLLVELEQVRSQLTGYSGWIERLAVQEREMRVKQTELRSALQSCRSDQRRLVQLRRYLAQLDSSERGRRSPSNQARVDEYQQEIERYMAALHGWRARLEAGERELARLQQAARPALASRIALHDDLSRLEQIQARLLMLQGRIDSGENKALDASYYQIVQSILECKLQVEQIKQRRLVDLSDQDTTRFQADFDALASTFNAYSLELLRIRRRIRHLQLLLVRSERRRGSLTLEDVGKASIDLEGLGDEPAAPDAPARPAGGATRTTVSTDDREPLIEWEVLQDQQTADARISLAIRVRNPHVDLIFGNLAVELTVRRKVAGAAEEEIVTLSPGSRLEFGDVRFSQQWITREITLEAARLQQGNLLVYVIATWTVWPVGFAAAGQDRTSDLGYQPLD